MRKLARIVAWIAAAIAGLAVCAVVAVAILSHTAWFRDLVRGKVNAVLAGTFKGRLSIGGLQGSIWGDLVLRDVTLTYQGDRIAHIQRMRVAYGILSLLDDTIDLTHLDLSGVELSGKQDEKGRWNAMEALASVHPSAPTSGGETRFRVLVREISLARGAISVTRSGGEAYSFDGAALSGSAYILKSGMRLKVGSLYGQLSGTNLPPSTVFADVSYQDAIKPGTANIKAVRITTRDSQLELSGAVGNLDTLSMDLRLNVRKIGGADITRFAAKWTPSANLTGNAHLVGSRPDLHLTLALDAADAKVRGDIHADLREPGPHYRGFVDVFNLQPAHLLDLQGFAGVVNASIRGQGAGESIAGFNGTANVRLGRAAYAQWNVGDVILNADVANSGATFKMSVAQGQRAGASASGKIDFRGTTAYQVSLTADHLDLEKVQPAAGRIMRTDLNLAAQVQGRGFKAETAEATARVDWRRSMLGPVRIDSGAVRASVARGIMQLSQASLSAGATKADVKGQVALTGTRRGDISYYLDCNDVAPWMALAGQQGSGKLQVVGRVDGPLNQLRVRGSASLIALKTAGVSVGGGQATYYVDGVPGDKAHGRIDLSLGAVHTQVDLKSIYLGVDLVSLHPTQARILVDTWDAQSRNQKLAAEVRVQPAIIDVKLNELSLQMADGTWQLPRPATIHQDARLLSIEGLEVDNAQKSIRVAGQVAFGGAQNFLFTISGFDLADANPFFANDPGLGGTLDFSLHASGTAAAPVLNSQLSIKPVKARGYTLDEVSAKADFTGGKLSASAVVHQNPKHELDADVTLPLELGWDRRFVAYASGGINGRVHSSGLGLAFLNSLNPRQVQNIAGQLSMDIALTGPIKHPLANGGIWLWGGRGTIVPLGVTIASLSSSVSVTPNAIYLQDLNLRAEDGTIDSWGSVGLDGYRPNAVDLRLKMRSWPAIKTSQYLINTAADVTLKGTPQAAKLGGKVDVLWGVIKPEISFLSNDTVKPDHTIQVVYNGVAPPPPPKAPPPPGANLFKNLAINMMVEIHRDTWVKVASSSVELEGKVRVLKDPRGPVTLRGSIHTVRGQISVAQRPLTIQKGEVTFTGGVPINPSLDIVAQKQVPNYIVSAEIQGTVKKPKLTLTSSPQMSQADILAVLMFGRPTSNLNGGQQASLQNQAATLAGSFAVSAVGQSVADALGLETLQFSVENGMAGVGTYVAPNVFLSASQNVAPQTQQMPGQASQKATIQFYVTPQIEIDTSQSRSPMGNASEIDLFWHREY
jgi:autotransporter translocation and assembly factor TamB